MNKFFCDKNGEFIKCCWSGSSNGWYSTMVDVYVQDDTLYNNWLSNNTLS